MTVRCSQCKRFRGPDGVWHEDEPEVYCGICPTCLALKKKLDELKWAREGRRLKRERRRGYGPAKAEEDVFKGFREE